MREIDVHARLGMPKLECTVHKKEKEKIYTLISSHYFTLISVTKVLNLAISFMLNNNIECCHIFFWIFPNSIVVSFEQRILYLT